MVEEKLKVEEEIQKALEINVDSIAEELQEQSATYFYYSCSWAMASRKRRHQKLALETTRARLGQEFKEKMRQEDAKVRITERMLDDYLSEKPEYQQALKDYFQAEYVESMLEVAKDAFRQRAQMLNELSRSHSDEKFYGSEFKVMKAEMEQRDEKVQKKRAKKKNTTTEAQAPTPETE